MTVESVFKSDDAAVLAVHAQWKAEAERQREFAAALKAEHGRDVLCRRSGFSGTSIIGLSPHDEDRAKDAPKGFRLGAKEGYFCPDKRTPEGRDLAKRFADERLKKPVYPGMPDEAWTDDDRKGQSHVYSPGFMFADGYVWATWGCGSDRLISGDGLSLDTGRRVDMTIWSLAKLSEYHAARESLEAVSA